MSRLHQRVLLSYGVAGMEHNSASSHNRLPLAFASSGGSRPGLSFPLGTGLVVLIILFVSALFSFCYHWLTLKKSRATNSPSTSATSAGFDAAQQATSAPLEDGKPLPTIAKLEMVQCPPVVYMAGEYIPRFIAVPCPFVNPSLSLQAAAQDIAAAHEKALYFDAIKLDIRQ